MLSDNSYLHGSEGISLIKKEMEYNFKKNIKLIDEDCDLHHHGWFLIKYEYIPHEYLITFEGEFNTFNIRISDREGGFIALKQLVGFNNLLLKNNIVVAISNLKKVLNLPIAFYKIIDDKLFYQIDGQYKRVKGW